MRLKAFTFLICAIATSQLYAQTQKGQFNPGWSIGVNTAQIHGDGYLGFNKIGLTGGAYIYTDLNDKWRGQFEIVYINKGSRKPARPKQGDPFFWAINLHYIEIPLLAQYKWKKFIFETGFTYAFLFRQVKRDAFGTDPVALTAFGPFNQQELGYIIGINAPMGKKMLFNWRYQNSLTPIAGKLINDPTRLFSFIGGAYNVSMGFTMKFDSHRSK